MSARISVVTTAVNRPEVLRQTLTSVLEQSDLLALGERIEWLFHVDCVPGIPDADAAFQETVALCQSMAAHVRRVHVVQQSPATGPSAAITRLLGHVTGQVVFFLEDDWLCHPELDTGERFSLARMLPVLDEHAYINFRGRRGKVSMQPCLMRAANFLETMAGLQPGISAEDQWIANWAERYAADNATWSFHPDPPTYFSDLGHPWMRQNGLRKWARRQRYGQPITYNIATTHQDPGYTHRLQGRTVDVFASLKQGD